MRVIRISLLLLLFQLLTAFPARCATVPIPPAPARWVTDTAGFLSGSSRQMLDADLEAFARQTGHQMIVWIGRTTGGTPIEDWAVQAFRKWKIGRKGLNDGLAMIIMADDHKIRIEVGYGLEGVVPDVIAFQIIDRMKPLIQAGHHDEAVQAGVQDLESQITGKPLSPPALQTRPSAPRVYGGQRSAGLGQMIFFGFVSLIFLIILITHPSFALFLLYVLMSGGGRGGGGFSGGGFSGGGDGGFSGGGGSSGGGGATGGW